MMKLSNMINFDYSFLVSDYGKLQYPLPLLLLLLKCLIFIFYGHPMMKLSDMITSDYSFLVSDHGKPLYPHLFFLNTPIVGINFDLKC